MFRLDASTGNLDRLLNLKRIAVRLGLDEKGSTAIFTAVVMMALMSLGALALDMNGFYAARGQLQNTADASALAAIQAFPDEVAAAAAAEGYAEKNMPATQYGQVIKPADVVTGYWDPSARTFTAGGNPRNAVRVAARRSQLNNNAVPTFFANALGMSSVDISAEAIAIKTVGAGCIIALNPSVDEAFYIQGNASVETFDCDIQVNSCHASEALRAQGNTDVRANGAEINVCGGVRKQGPAFFSPLPNEQTGEQVADPFAEFCNPVSTCYDDTAGCNFNNFSSSGSVTLNPGVYCGGIRLTGNGTATFNPGLFIIKNGEFFAAGNKNIVGSGVTFFLTGASANLNFGGTADIGFSAPTTGSFKGFLFVGDRDNPATTAHLMRGTAIGGYNGFIYLPSAQVRMAGTATGSLGSSDCTVAVADTFEFAGTPNFEAKKDCSAYGGLPSGSTKLVN